MADDSERQPKTPIHPSTQFLKFKLWLLDKFHPNELSITLIWAGLVGIAGGVCAIIFRIFLAQLQIFFLGSHENLIIAAQGLSIGDKVFVPILGAGIGGLILYFGFQIWKKIGTGTDILEAIVIRDGVIRSRATILKAFSSLFCISTGSSLGREGPILQLSAMSASKLGQYFKIPKQRLSLITACGAASGIAAAYNAPIAGALFVMEIILGNFAIEIFGPLVFSSVIATIVSRAYFGSQPIYQIPSFTLVSHWELIPYLILGILGGVLASGFQYLLTGIRQLFEKIQIHFIVKFLFGGLVIGLLGIRYPYIWGNGYETVDMILHNQLTWELILVLLFLKAFATSVCLGSGMVGGLFTPTLFLGASLGAVFGYFIHQSFPAITGPAGGYALVGMGCLVAGTTHAPLTAILILFELSLNYSIILPLLLSCTVSTFIARQIHKHSVYTKELERQGGRMTTNPEAMVMTSMTVKEIYVPETESIQPDTSFSDIVNRFFQIGRNNIYVTDKTGTFLGAVSLNELREIIQHEQVIKFVVAYDIMNPNFLYTLPTERLSNVMEKFWMQDCERLPVLNNMDDKKLIGTISKRDILRLYSQEVLGKHHLLTRFSHGHENDLETMYLDLGQDISIESLPVPDIFDGMTLASLNLRSRYHIQVVLVRRKDSLGQEMKIQPNPYLRLQKKDYWVVLGKREDLIKFKEHMKNPLLSGLIFIDGEGI